MLGGFGSGGCNKRHDRLEARQRIAVGYLVRRGLAKPYASGVVSWSDGRGQPSGSIGVEGLGDGVLLSYRTQSGYGGDWTPMKQRISFAYLPRPFGGQQTYFVCPKCTRRTMELALGGQRFACRLCQNLVHSSSQKSAVDRAALRGDRLRRKLGAEPGVETWYVKPKRMRHSTFERIDAAIQAADSEVMDEQVRMLSRIAGPVLKRRNAPQRRGRKPEFWA